MIIEQSDSLNLYFVHSFNLRDQHQEVFPLINEQKPITKKPTYIINDIGGIGISNIAQSKDVFSSMFSPDISAVKLERVQEYRREELLAYHNCKSPFFVEAHWTYKMKNIAFNTWSAENIRLVWYYAETGMLNVNK